MNEKEKEKYILKFMYMVLTDKRNQNRYSGTAMGNMEKNKMVRLSDCINYLEEKYEKLSEKGE